MFTINYVSTLNQTAVQNFEVTTIFFLYVLEWFLKYYRILNTGVMAALPTEINYILTYIKIENSYFQIVIMFKNIAVFTVFLS